MKKNIDLCECAINKHYLIKPLSHMGGPRGGGAPTGGARMGGARMG